MQTIISVVFVNKSTCTGCCSDINCCVNSSDGHDRRLTVNAENIVPLNSELNNIATVNHNLITGNPLLDVALPEDDIVVQNLETVDVRLNVNAESYVPLNFEQSNDITVNQKLITGNPILDRVADANDIVVDRLNIEPHNFIRPIQSNFWTAEESQCSDGIPMITTDDETCNVSTLAAVTAPVEIVRYEPYIPPGSREFTETEKQFSLAMDYHFHTPGFSIGHFYLDEAGNPHPLPCAVLNDPCLYAHTYSGPTPLNCTQWERAVRYFPGDDMEIHRRRMDWLAFHIGNLQQKLLNPGDDETKYDLRLNTMTPNKPLTIGDIEFENNVIPQYVENILQLISINQVNDVDVSSDTMASSAERQPFDAHRIAPWKSYYPTPSAPPGIPFHELKEPIKIFDEDTRQCETALRYLRQDTGTYCCPIENCKDARKWWSNIYNFAYHIRGHHIMLNTDDRCFEIINDAQVRQHKILYEWRKFSRATKDELAAQQNIHTFEQYYEYQVTKPKMAQRRVEQRDTTRARQRSDRARQYVDNRPPALGGRYNRQESGRESSADSGYRNPVPTVPDRRRSAEDARDARVFTNSRYSDDQDYRRSTQPEQKLDLRDEIINRHQGGYYTPATYPRPIPHPTNPPHPTSTQPYSSHRPKHRSYSTCTTPAPHHNRAPVKRIVTVSEAAPITTHIGFNYRTARPRYSRTTSTLPRSSTAYEESRPVNRMVITDTPSTETVLKTTEPERMIPNVKYSKDITATGEPSDPHSKVVHDFNEVMARKSYAQICADLHDNNGLPMRMSTQHVIDFMAQRENETLPQSIELLVTEYEKANGITITQVERRNLAMIAKAVFRTQYTMGRSYNALNHGMADLADARKFHRQMNVFEYRAHSAPGRQPNANYSLDFADITYSPTYGTESRIYYAMMPVTHPSARMMCTVGEDYDRHLKIARDGGHKIKTPRLEEPRQPDELEIQMDTSSPEDQLLTVDETIPSSQVQIKVTLPNAPLANFEDISDADTDDIDLSFPTDTADFFSLTSGDENGNFLDTLTLPENKTVTGNTDNLGTQGKQVTFATSTDPLVAGKILSVLEDEEINTHTPFLGDDENANAFQKLSPIGEIFGPATNVCTFQVPTTVRGRGRRVISTAQKQRIKKQQRKNTKAEQEIAEARMLKEEAHKN